MTHITKQILTECSSIKDLKDSDNVLAYILNKRFDYLFERAFTLGENCELIGMFFNPDIETYDILVKMVDYLKQRKKADK